MNAHPSIPKVPALKFPCCIIIFHIKWPSYIIILLHKLAPLSSTGFGETQDNSGTLEISRSWLGKTAAFLPCNGLASFPSASSTSKPWPIVAKLVPSSRERRSTAQASLWSSRVAFNVWGISPPAIGMAAGWNSGILGEAISNCSFSSRNLGLKGRDGTGNWIAVKKLLPVPSLMDNNPKIPTDYGHDLPQQFTPVRNRVVSLNFSPIAMAPCCLFFGSNTSCHVWPWRDWMMDATVTNRQYTVYSSMCIQIYIINCYIYYI